MSGARRKSRAGERKETSRLEVLVWTDTTVTEQADVRDDDHNDSKTGQNSRS